MPRTMKPKKSSYRPVHPKWKTRPFLGIKPHLGWAEIEGDKLALLTDGKTVAAIQKGILYPVPQTPELREKLKLALQRKYGQKF